MRSAISPWDVVIVGGGSAGLSAALILARARRRVIVLDGGEPRNRFAPHMHGVLGRDGYSPLGLVADGRREVIAADGVIETARVVTIARADGFFDLTTDSGEVIRGSRVILATGIRDDLPDIPGLAEEWGRGAVACPYCDGYEARGLRIGVLLGSIAGVHKVHMVRSYSADVTVFTSLVGELPDADLLALAARGIRVEDRPVDSVVSEGGALAGVRMVDGATVGVERLFVDPAMVPLDGLSRQLGVDQVETPMGTWAATDATFETSVPGVFVVGNLASPAALVPIAMAAGVTAATAINSQLVVEDIGTALEALVAS